MTKGPVDGDGRVGRGRDGVRERRPRTRRGAKPRGGKKGGSGRRRGPAKPASRGPRSRGPRPQVVVFARAPEPGRVKTRLSPALRPDEAADLYRALLLDTVDVVRSAGAELVVAFTPGSARRALERLLGPRHRLLPQPPGDLGDRLEGILSSIQGGRRPVCVVGSDCPGLTPERVREAVVALESVPVVLGPALDGGFYLLGLSGPAPGLLRGVPWSTDRVLDAVRSRCAARGLSVHELGAERDLDTPDDLFEWFAVARASNRETDYPRTWRILHSLMTPRRVAELQDRLPESP